MAAFMAMTQPVYGQNTDKRIVNIRDDNAKSVIKELKEETAKIETLEAQVETLSAKIEQVSSIPDSIPIILKGDTLGWLPVKDGKVVFDTITGFVKENNGSWPKTAMGWITLLFTAIVGGKFTQAIVSAKRVYAYLKPKFKDTLYMVALVSMLLSFVATYLLGKLMGSNGFDETLFMAVSLAFGFISVFIYEKTVKPKQTETQPKVHA